MVIVREVVAGDAVAWRRLWATYLQFYKTELPAAVTEHTWRRLLDPTSRLFCRVAERDGAVVGFAMCVLHDGTWTLTPICYLEDLYVDADARGAGAGRALIEDLLRLAREHGWARLYWHTDADNITARRLYDSFVPVDPVVRYRIALR